MYIPPSYQNIILLTSSQCITYSLHHQWNLLDPVNFMKCYSFLHSLVGTMAILQQQLEAQLAPDYFAQGKIHAKSLGAC
jgi:hypothetical protein